VARIWAELAIVGYLLWQAGVASPIEGEAGYWERLAGLVVVAIIVVGHLLSWRWEIQGATVMAVGGALLALITSFRYVGLQETVVVLLAFTGPAFLYWWLWRRGRSHRAVAALAGLLSVLVVAVLALGLVVQDLATGPFHPQSDLPALAPAPVLWVWSGALAPTSAAVVARVTDPAAQVRLAVASDPGLSEPLWVAASQRPADDPALVRFDVTGLAPGVRYHYAVEVDGEVVEQRAGQFRTIPSGPTSFSFALGSCARVGSNGSVFDRIREAAPDLFLITGDFAYEDFWTNDRAAFRGMYDTQLTTPAMDALVRSVPVAYIWDDHDFGPNDADSTSASAPAAQVVYRQAVPHPPLPAGTGPEPVYQSFTLGRVRFILTDARSDKSPKGDPDDADKTMLGARQLQWLADQLESAADAGEVVVLATSLPWNGAAAAGSDDWSGYTTERRRIADLIAAAGLTDQLLMIAGDAHMVAIDDGTHTDFSTDRSGGFPLMHAAALDRPGSFKAGPYSEGAHPGAGQFGLVTIDDEGTGITLTLSGRDHTGAELVGYRFTIPASALVPGSS
jgi:phosphodiesterase/alkaline phosphatase D-like protein